MSDGRIYIERERDKFCVRLSDPEIEKANRNSGKDTPWQDPMVEYDFADKAQVLKFLDKAMDIALPADDYSSAFGKLAKEAGGEES